jgi:uncharacterized protein YacL
MKQNQLWAIFIILLIAVINVVIRQFYAAWSSTGLILSLLIGTPLLLICFTLILKDRPRTEKEVKAFKYEGLFNPIWGAIIFFVISLMWTMGAINGSIPLLMTIIAWIIAFVYLFFWIKLKVIKAGQ